MFYVNTELAEKLTLLYLEISHPTVSSPEELVDLYFDALSRIKKYKLEPDKPKKKQKINY